MKNNFKIEFKVLYILFGGEIYNGRNKKFTRNFKRN